jgi:hypothetical protein
MKLAVCVLFVVVAVVLAHPGGLDKYGGHYNRKTGVYHSHKKGTVIEVPTNPPPDVVVSNYPPLKLTNSVQSSGPVPYRSVEQLPPG